MIGGLWFVLRLDHKENRRGKPTPYERKLDTLIRSGTINRVRSQQVKIKSKKLIIRSEELKMFGKRIIAASILVLAVLISGSKALSVDAADENDVKVQKSPQEANAVRLVVGTRRMTFEGSNVTWKTLPSFLEKVQAREQTIFELAVDNKKIPLAVYEESEKRAQELVKRFGFSGLRYVGVFPLGSSAGDSLSGPPKRKEKPRSETKLLTPVGKWETVDYVPAIEVFELGKKSWTSEFLFKNLSFLTDGRTSGPWLWKKNYIWHPGNKSLPKGKIVIKEIGGDTYLFMEWITPDVTKRGLKPFYYVLKKVGDIKKS